MREGEGIVAEGFNKRPQFAECIIKDEGFLRAGNYHIVVDPVWEPETTDRDPLYKKILVDVYCSEDVDLFVGDDTILNVLKASFKAEAQAKADKDKTKYLAGNDGLDGAYNVVDVTGRHSWWGYIYFNNATQTTLLQTLTF